MYEFLINYCAASETLANAHNYIYILKNLTFCSTLENNTAAVILSGGFGNLNDRSNAFKSAAVELSSYNFRNECNV